MNNYLGRVPRIPFTGETTYIHTGLRFKHTKYFTCPDAEEDERLEEQKVTAYQEHIERNNERLLKATEDIADAKQREEQAEQGISFLQQQIADLEKRALEGEQRLAELEVLLKKTESEERKKGRSEDKEAIDATPEFWVVRKEEVQLNKDEVLGTGGWGTVYVGVFRGLRVATKCMHDLILSDYNRTMFSREMAIAATVRHPNLVQFIGATMEGHPVILTELMATSLRAELERQPLTAILINSISIDIAQALLYLHLMQPDPIIHRDVSSANVLLNPGPDNSWLAKLSDYGSANFLRQLKTEGPGNPSYAAPEANVPLKQSTKMDVYSFGVLLLEMWCCQFPDKEKFAKMMQSLEKESVKDVVSGCLQLDPTKRPDFNHLLLQLHNQ